MFVREFEVKCVDGFYDGNFEFICDFRYEVGDLFYEMIYISFVVGFE